MKDPHASENVLHHDYQCQYTGSDTNYSFATYQPWGESVKSMGGSSVSFLSTVLQLSQSKKVNEQQMMLLEDLP